MTPCTPRKGEWKSADDEGMCSKEKDKSEDFDAMNHEEDKEIGQNSAEGKAWDDTVYTKDDSKSQVIGDAEAAKGHAEDAAQQKAVADNRAAGYTGHSWGKSEELLQDPDTVAATKAQSDAAGAEAAKTKGEEDKANAESAAADKAAADSKKVQEGMTADAAKGVADNNKAAADTKADADAKSAAADADTAKSHADDEARAKKEAEDAAARKKDDDDAAAGTAARNAADKADNDAIAKMKASAEKTGAEAEAAGEAAEKTNADAVAAANSKYAADTAKNKADEAAAKASADSDAAKNAAADDAADAKNAADAAAASKANADKTAADEAEAKKNADSAAKAVNDKNDAATAAADKAVSDNSDQEDKDIADEDADEDEDVAEDEADVQCKEDEETFQPIECKVKVAGHIKCVAITGKWKSADDDGMCSTSKDKSEDFDAMNAEAAKGHAEDAAQQKAVADNRAAGYTGHSWGKSEEIMQADANTEFLVDGNDDIL